MLFSKLLKAKKKIHFTNSYRRLLVSGVRSEKRLPETLRALSLLAVVKPELRSQIDSWANNNPELKSSKTIVPDIFKTNLDKEPHKKFDIPEDYLVLAPGSVWETKKWPAQKFGELANLMKARLNIPVVLLGSKQELELSRQIRQIAPSVIDLTGETDLIECRNIIANSYGFVGNDSGLVHMAALFNIPSVVVLGPTHQSLGFVPWQNNIEVASLNLECSPCGTHGSNSCPIKTHACMTMLEASLVMSHLIKALKKAGAFEKKEALPQSADSSAAQSL
jgi:heptosyltransferase-2